MDASAYGAGSPVTVVFDIPFIVLGVLVFLFLSLKFYFARANAWIWGGILAVLYGLPLYGLVPNVFNQLSSPCCGPTLVSSWVLFAAEAVPLAVGLVGGLWGFFEKSSGGSGQKPGDQFVPRLTIAAGALSTVGFFSLANELQGQSQLIPEASIFILGPVAVIVSGAVLYNRRWRPRILGILIIVGSLPSVLLSVILIGTGVQWYFPNYAPGLISFLASGLTLMLGLRTSLKRTISASLT
jgi:hypothetical protein